ncbi:MAG TPA: MnhB domain-containing protein [Marinagarivorans sp.]
MSKLNAISIALLVLAAMWFGAMIFLLPNDNLASVGLIQSDLANAGASNAVTAVLLNFRGYDTYLELVVLLIAVTGVCSLNILPTSQLTATTDKPGMVLDALAKPLLILLIMVAFYLLWLGSHGPGGAFQAGALLGAAGVLMVLAGYPIMWRIDHKAVRGLLTLGVLSFTCFGLLSLASQAGFFTYPLNHNKTIIFTIEFAAMCSIGTTLTILFISTTTNNDRHVNQTTTKR